MKICTACKRRHFAKKLLALDKKILETHFNIVQCKFSEKLFQEITANTCKKYHIHTTALWSTLGRLTVTATMSVYALNNNAPVTLFTAVNSVPGLITSNN